MKRGSMAWLLSGLKVGAVAWVDAKRGANATMAAVHALAAPGKPCEGLRFECRSYWAVEKRHGTTREMVLVTRAA